MLLPSKRKQDNRLAHDFLVVAELVIYMAVVAETEPGHQGRRGKDGEGIMPRDLNNLLLSSQ